MHLVFIFPKILSTHFFVEPVAKRKHTLSWKAIT